MFSNKYGNILTMILVVLIVAILGILGYFTYSYFYSQAVNNNANSALEEFKNSTSTVKKDTSNIDSDEDKENTTDVPVVDPQELLNNANQNNNTVTEPENPDENKVMMEDYEVMGSIKIPKTGIELPILDKTTKRSLELSVAIAYGPGLNEEGNTIIFGHNYRNGMFFSDNKKITNGDKIYITDKNNETVTYIVFDVYETTQNDASYMERQVAEGVREISLQTCTDDSSGRIIVCAREEGK